MKLLAVLAASLTVVALGFVPARAGHPPASCKPFRPASPPGDSFSANPEDAITAPLLRLDKRATEQNPVVWEYRVDPTIHYFVPLNALPPGAVTGGSAFVNVQSIASAQHVKINIEIDWAKPSADELGLYFYSSYGSEVGSADRLNVRDGMGLEKGSFDAGRCHGYTIETWPFWSVGQDVTMRAWLSPAGK